MTKAITATPAVKLSPAIYKKGAVLKVGKMYGKPFYGVVNRIFSTPFNEGSTLVEFSSYWEEDGEISFINEVTNDLKTVNVSWVEGLVKAGQGPILTTLPSKAERNAAFLEEMKEINQYLNVSTKHKSQYVLHNTPTALRALALTCFNRHFAKVNAMVDVDYMVQLIKQHGLTKPVILSNSVVGAVVINKKKLYQFLKQNQNKFLMNVKDAIRKQALAMDWQYDMSDDYCSEYLS